MAAVSINYKANTREILHGKLSANFRPQRAEDLIRYGSSQSGRDRLWRHSNRISGSTRDSDRRL